MILYLTANVITFNIYMDMNLKDIKILNICQVYIVSLIIASLLFFFFLMHYSHLNCFETLKDPGWKIYRVRHFIV